MYIVPHPLVSGLVHIYMYKYLGRKLSCMHTHTHTVCLACGWPSVAMGNNYTTCNIIHVHVHKLYTCIYMTGTKVVSVMRRVAAPTH